MSRTRLALSAGLAVTAGLLALLANGVFAASAGGPGGAFHVRTAEWILGAGDERAFHDAAVLVAESRQPGTPAARSLELHAEAEAELSRLARRGGSPQLRSAAANLAGVLLLEDSALDPRSARRLRDLARESFRDAARLDPESDAAKLNLELLLDELGRTSGRKGGGGSQGEEGAGAAPEGSGY